MCAAELSLGSTQSNVCEDELFQSEVSSGRTFSSQICPNQICKTNLWLRRYLIGTTLFVEVQCPIDNVQKMWLLWYLSMLSKSCLYIYSRDFNN